MKLGRKFRHAHSPRELDLVDSIERGGEAATVERARYTPNPNYGTTPQAAATVPEARRFYGG